jgi:hypothetical protein
MSVPRDKTLEVPARNNRCNRCKLGYHNNHTRKCDECGSTDKYPAKWGRRRIIGGKRGRNSGTVGTSKTKKS